MGARGVGIVAAGVPHSPKRSSTVHTSARRPPGAGEARSGALQERPARKSRACTYSRPSALAWATSSLSVGERSKASMISAAKTEERRSTSMAEVQARGTTPTTDKAQPDGLQPSREGTPATRGDLEAQREAQRSPPRAPRSSADPKLTEEVGWPPPSKRASFGWPLVLLPKPFKTQCHVLLGSKLNHRRWSRVGSTARKIVIGSVVTVPRFKDQFGGDGGSRVAWATRRQGLLRPGNQLPSKALNGAAIQAKHLCTSQSGCLFPVSPFPWCYSQGTDATPARLTSLAAWRAGRLWSSGFRTRSPLSPRV